MMRLLFLTILLSIACDLYSSALFAQSEQALVDAVRDQYVDAIDEQKLNEIERSDKLLGLDEYSHFLSEKELSDVSADPNAMAFAYALSEQLLYMRIPVFHAKTSFQIHQAIIAVQQNSSASHIIIDLRGNRGGLLNAATEVADEFVATGILATTKGRLDTANLVFLAKPDDQLENRKIAVLIDKNTASAAELLAGILKLNANACILGQHSFGKSAVQTQIRLISGGALSLTTATYFFSNGETVDKKGIRPDIGISSWQLWSNPPYLRVQNARTLSLRNPLIEKSLHCMNKQ